MPMIPLDPPRHRFQVPDVILPNFLSKKLWLQRLTPEDGGSSSAVYLSDKYNAVLRHDPFEIFVRRQSTNRLVLSLNSHRLFDYEPLRKKEEGDDWEERLRGHTDTRPHDPQSITLDVSFFGSKFVTGIPEHATSLALSESPFGLYDSIPHMISHCKAGNSAGFFWLNAAEMQIYVLGKGWDSETGLLLPSEQDWMAEAGIVDALFFIGPGPKDVVRQYARVTGKPSMPPLFSTAYHQCRWNYRDVEDVENVDAKELRSHDMLKKVKIDAATEKGGGMFAMVVGLWSNGGAFGDDARRTMEEGWSATMWAADDCGWIAICF
ncbi:hypothetical protein Tsubulata_048913 [Turnera subulata]|uniref:Glycoside hydrolase family 31 N-terminal domain-containing protein n=1 Tax=Turnera subulata TaxID=218843 RepID=A0A9Q0FUP4_9ROSI|nr:hypothetical protein Tsubulata_048913 [Turnera subulata]